MTWEDLSEIIKSMPDELRNKNVTVFFEGYLGYTSKLKIENRTHVGIYLTLDKGNKDGL